MKIRMKCSICQTTKDVQILAKFSNSTFGLCQNCIQLDEPDVFVCNHLATQIISGFLEDYEHCLDCGLDLLPKIKSKW